MARVVFAKAFRRHVDCPDAGVGGSTVREVLDAYFDDGGAVRKHVAVFVNDDLITDRSGLADPVGDDDRVHIFQALSGG